MSNVFADITASIKQTARDTTTLTTTDAVRVVQHYANYLLRRKELEAKWAEQKGTTSMSDPMERYERMVAAEAEQRIKQAAGEHRAPIEDDILGLLGPVDGRILVFSHIRGRPTPAQLSAVEQAIANAKHRLKRLEVLYVLLKYRSLWNVAGNPPEEWKSLIKPTGYKLVEVIKCLRTVNPSIQVAEARTVIDEYLIALHAQASREATAPA